MHLANPFACLREGKQNVGQRVPFLIQTANLDSTVADKFYVLPLGHFLIQSHIDIESASQQRKSNELATDDSEREQGQEAEGRKEIL